MGNSFLNALQEGRFALYDVNARPVNSRGRTFSTKPAGRVESGFIFIKDGQCEYRFGESFQMCPGDLAYLPEGGMYVYETLSESISYTLINFTVRDSAGQRIALSPNPVMVSGHPSPFYKLKTDELLQAYLQGGYGRTLTCIAIIYEMLAQLANELQIQFISQKGYANISPAIIYLEQHYMEAVKTGQLAQLCSLSESQFRRVFEKYRNMTPMAYKNHLRIQQAYVLLANGTYTVSEVADLLGFNDIFYFSSLFKKITGYAPRSIRTKSFKA